MSNNSNRATRLLLCCWVLPKCSRAGNSRRLLSAGELRRKHVVCCRCCRRLQRRRWPSIRETGDASWGALSELTARWGQLPQDWLPLVANPGLCWGALSAFESRDRDFALRVGFWLGAGRNYAFARGRPSPGLRPPWRTLQVWQLWRWSDSHFRGGGGSKWNGNGNWERKIAVKYWKLERTGWSVLAEASGKGDWEWECSGFRLVRGPFLDAKLHVCSGNVLAWRAAVVITGVDAALGCLCRLSISPIRSRARRGYRS